MDTKKETTKHGPWIGSASLPLGQRDQQQLLRMTKAMWALLKAHLNLSDVQLHQMLVEIDTQTPQLTTCSMCRNPLQSTAQRCLFCGTVPQIEVSNSELQTRLSRIRLTEQ